ncbi:unnamed protein product [Durusdinium trenchii]|uniref:Uncharacterized protein n=1 Tax=Durusdinium trenchii TaxID=1381693 RepID=A0ABP0S163_9DINO
MTTIQVTILQRCCSSGHFQSEFFMPFLFFRVPGVIYTQNCTGQTNCETNVGSSAPSDESRRDRAIRSPLGAGNEGQRLSFAGTGRKAVQMIRHWAKECSSPPDAYMLVAKDSPPRRTSLCPVRNVGQYCNVWSRA